VTDDPAQVAFERIVEERDEGTPLVKRSPQRMGCVACDGGSSKVK